MRLIDADELRKEIHMSYSDDLGIREVIDEQPTAYDVDKVVEQINDAMIPTPEYRHKLCGTVAVEHCTKYENCEGCIAKMIIEIIKSGGVEK